MARRLILVVFDILIGGLSPEEQTILRKRMMDLLFTVAEAYAQQKLYEMKVRNGPNCNL